MARFELSRTLPLSPAECWERVTDWPRHGAGVPLTRVFASRGTGLAVGDVVTARTSVGPVGFADPMEIMVMRPPGPGRDGLCRLLKRGAVVHGWAELRVRASGSGSGDGGAEVGWLEEIRVAGLPRLADPLLERAGRRVFGRALDRLLS